MQESRSKWRIQRQQVPGKRPAKKGKYPLPINGLCRIFTDFVEYIEYSEIDCPDSERCGGKGWKPLPAINYRQCRNVACALDPPTAAPAGGRLFLYNIIDKSNAKRGAGVTENTEKKRIYLA